MSACVSLWISVQQPKNGQNCSFFQCLTTTDHKGTDSMDGPSPLPEDNWQFGPPFRPSLVAGFLWTNGKGRIGAACLPFCSGHVFPANESDIYVHFGLGGFHIWRPQWVGRRGSHKSRQQEQSQLVCDSDLGTKIRKFCGRHLWKPPTTMNSCGRARF